MATQAVQKQEEQAVVPLRQAIENGIQRNWQQLIAGSLVLSTIEAAQLDLEFGAKKHGYLIPYKDKATGTMMCGFRPGYLGLAHAAKRSGEVKEVRAEVVYEKDEFQYELGAFKQINFHRPATGDRGKLACVYAVAIFPDGTYDFEVLSALTRRGLPTSMKWRRKRQSGSYVSDCRWTIKQRMRWSWMPATKPKNSRNQRWKCPRRSQHERNIFTNAVQSRRILHRQMH